MGGRYYPKGFVPHGEPLRSQAEANFATRIEAALVSLTLAEFDAKDADYGSCLMQALSEARDALQAVERMIK